MSTCGLMPPRAVPVPPHSAWIGLRRHWDLQDVCCGGLPGRGVEEASQESSKLAPGERSGSHGPVGGAQDGAGSLKTCLLLPGSGAAGFPESRPMLRARGGSSGSLEPWLLHCWSPPAACPVCVSPATVPGSCARWAGGTCMSLRFHGEPAPVLPFSEGCGALGVERARRFPLCGECVSATLTGQAPGGQTLFLCHGQPSWGCRHLQRARSCVQKGCR